MSPKVRQIQTEGGSSVAVVELQPQPQPPSLTYANLKSTGPVRVGGNAKARDNGRRRGGVGIAKARRMEDFIVRKLDNVVHIVEGPRTAPLKPHRAERFYIAGRVYFNPIRQERFVGEWEASGMTLEDFQNSTPPRPVKAFCGTVYDAERVDRVVAEMRRLNITW